MDWKYVEPLVDSKSIENIEQKYKLEIPKKLKEVILKYNGGCPSKKVFDTKDSKERVVQNLISYNKESKESIYMYESIFNMEYIPFAITPFGDIICINKKTKAVELYLHEENKFEYICDDIDDFFKKLYN